MLRQIQGSQVVAAAVAMCLCAAECPCGAIVMEPEHA
jgi:hypothetical protein